VLSLLDLHFVKPGILTKELSTWIHDAFEARQEADCGAEAVDPRAAAESTLMHAEGFVEKLRPVLTASWTSWATSRLRRRHDKREVGSSSLPRPTWFSPPKRVAGNPAGSAVCN
jgi:hypothetical protein